LTLDQALVCGVIALTLLIARPGALLEAGFTVGDYLAKILVPEESPLAGTRLADLGEATEADVWIAAILRDGDRLSSPAPLESITAEDGLLVCAQTAELRQSVQEAHVGLMESKPLGDEEG